MCGRYGALNSERITQFVRDLGVKGFSIDRNPDIRPSTQVPLIGPALDPVTATWGIQPAWAKRLLINAQGETVATKKTFSAAFHESRCLIPMDCWYEWRDEGGPRKQKYRFALPDGEPMLMAGVLYPGDDPAMVSLTIHPNAESAPIHNRMPVIIPADAWKTWLTGTPAAAVTLIDALPDGVLNVSPVNS